MSGIRKFCTCLGHGISQFFKSIIFCPFAIRTSSLAYRSQIKSPGGSPTGKNEMLSTLKTLFLIILFSLFSSRQGVSREDEVPYIPATQIEFTITPLCIYESSTGLFKYEYSIYSKPTSIQKIWTFDIEVRVKCENVTAPNGWHGDFRANIPPPGPVVSWGSHDGPFNIGPGNTINGLSMKSSGIPGVTMSYTAGWVDPPGPYEAGMVPEDNRPKWSEDSVKTKTIGPVPPPSDPFNPIIFVDYIIRMKGEASALGWIDDREVETSLTKKLFNARKNLGKKDNNAAINELKAFIVELVAQKGKHVNDSAFYLLEPNAEYLISRL